VGEAEYLEPAGEAFSQTALNQERSRAEEDDLEPGPAGSVFVPEPLNRLRPAGGFLSLVEHEERFSGGGLPGREAGDVPLLLDPCAVTKCRLVRAGVACRYVEAVGDLPDEGGLAYLPRAGDGLDEATRLFEAAQKMVAVGANVVGV
jgi:hypothetical protein